MDVKLSQREFRALASGSRVNAMKLLGTRRHTLSELAQKMGMSSPSMKSHMDTLLNAGLARQIDEGRKWKYYELTDAGREIALGEESESRVLVILGISGIALVAVLFVFAGSVGNLQLAAQVEGGAVLAAAEAPATADTIVGAPASAVAPAEEKDAESDGMAPRVVPGTTALGAGYDEQASGVNVVESAAEGIAAEQLVYAYAALAVLLAFAVGYFSKSLISRR